MANTKKLLIYASLLLFCLGSQPVFAKVDKARKKHEELIKGMPLYEHPELTAYVDRIGQKVAKNSDKPNIDYYFYIIDSPGINAFTPGNGYIYINRGLLTFFTSEAQLAAVLAHEIGHVTENHVGRQKRNAILGQVAATAATIATRHGGVGDAISISNAARFSGFGREMELEADERAAEYLYRSNYDPEAMLGVLGVLKDHERFSTLKEKTKGGGGSTYHGVFASHPRSDKRLKEVITKAGTLPPGEDFIGRDEWRKVLTGVVFGQNYTGNKIAGRERYTHKGLGITFTYPEGWSRRNKGKDIILKDADKTIQLKISLEKTKDKAKTSKEILEAKYPQDLKEVTLLGQQQDDKKQNANAKDLGATARYLQQRVAVIKVGRHTYYFQGIAKSGKLTEEQDKQFLEIINSFRRATRNDLPPDNVKTIYYERLKPGVTFADLAKDKTLGTYTEDYLRLINGYYPKGEAEPGTWIKLVK